MRIDRATAGIIYKMKHQNPIYIIRGYGVFKIRGLSLKCQIIAKAASFPTIKSLVTELSDANQCLLWAPVREDKMETSLHVSYCVFP